MQTHVVESRQILRDRLKNAQIIGGVTGEFVAKLVTGGFP
jgi:hypothetical protein